MQVEQQHLELKAPAVLKSLLDEFSAVTDYCTLRDSLPRRLASLLKCQCVLLYQRIGESLQFAAGTFDETPGWSSSLLTFAHINPIGTNSDTPEALAWRSHHAVTAPSESSTPGLVAVPLIYRQRTFGVLVAARSTAGNYWSGDEVQVIEIVAGVTAMLLENTRLLERDRERIHELSLLNSISSQFNRSMHELEGIRSIVVQRAREISAADLCELLLPSNPPGAIPWITPTLHKQLLQRMSDWQNPTPLVIEQFRDPHLIDERRIPAPQAGHPVWGTGNPIYRVPRSAAEKPGELLGPTLTTSPPVSEAAPPFSTSPTMYPYTEYSSQLAANIKTFFAIPLVSDHSNNGKKRGGTPGVLAQGIEVGSKVLGVLVGAYHRTWKLRHEELVLLQVLASQASAALENIYLMTEVLEARTEARKLLRQVVEDQRLKELILESIPSGLITTDRRGFITTFNSTAEAVLGYHPREALGQPLQKILDLRLTLPSPNDKTEPSSILVTVDRHGQEVVLELAISPLRNDRSEQIGLLITFNDVTSIHRLEEEKRRLDRLASLGEMAANVAHEVRNPLASIKTSMQMLLDDLAADDSGQLDSAGEAQESVSVVLKEVERLDAIVRDLLLFARPRQLQCVPCSLTALSDDVLQWMQAQCEKAGVVVHRVYQKVPLLQLDMAQMKQVLFNLYMNALQAMPDGGILTIACQVVSHWLDLSVSDTGVGIAPDQYERIFQPFFTTKAHGIGLGLPITRRLIEDHRGHLLVDSQLGYGTTISVRLPLVAENGSTSPGG